jgi:uncharacterized protein
MMPRRFHIEAPMPARFPIPRGWLSRIAAAALLLLGVTARADDAGQHVFWEVSGKHNTVYLLGSVHVLHANDHALPAVTDAAYLDAEIVIEELDLFAAMGEALQAQAMRYQILPDGQTLAAVLGPELHAHLKTAAAKLSLDVDFLGRMQPWMVATMITQLRMSRAGYTAQDGVDYQIAMRARRDGKPLKGLETATEQLGMLASMSMDEQKEFLRATLDEDENSRELREITDAWRNGDLAGLEALLRKGAEESPEFFKTLITDRNLKWLPQIEAMLADPKDDYLVVTGAAHMVGSEGVVELLKKKGYVVKRR